MFSLDLPRLSHPAEEIGAVLAKLQERLGTIPGVEEATFTGSPGGTSVQMPTQALASYSTFLDVGSRFFETMAIRILSGRAIDEHDRPNGPRTVVVNQEFAQRLFHGEDPLGKSFKGSNNMTYQIVGVCADWRDDQFREPIRPAVYGAWMQEPHAGSVNFRIRTTGEESVVRQIREIVRSVDPNLTIADVHTEQQQVENALSQERLMASLATVFGALALLLASIGIFGVMAYAVARRTKEIGIRVALGARPEGVAWMVLRETLMLGAFGIAIGLPAVLGLSPVLDHFLAPGWRNSFAYGLKPNDPPIIALAALVLASAGLLAGYLPARRAVRIDPMAALRAD